MVLKAERRGHTCLLTVDRAEVRQAINSELVDRLHDAISEANLDERVRVVVLAASKSGGVFLSGGDLKELQAVDMDVSGADQVVAMGRKLATIERCRLPVIAAVSGNVFGGGCELLMMCDVLVMEEHASLRFVHAKMGLAPAWGGTTRLIERIGAGRASEILLTARTVPAEEALMMGLAARVVPDGKALDAALALAEHLGKQAREALCNVKRSLQASRRANRGDALEREADVFRDAWGSEPHRAAFRAFSARKKG